SEAESKKNADALESFLGYVDSPRKIPKIENSQNYNYQKPKSSNIKVYHVESTEDDASWNTDAMVVKDFEKLNTYQGPADQTKSMPMAKNMQNYFQPGLSDTTLPQPDTTLKKIEDTKDVLGKTSKLPDESMIQLLLITLIYLLNEENRNLESTKFIAQTQSPYLIMKNPFPLNRGTYESFNENPFLKILNENFLLKSTPLFHSDVKTNSLSNNDIIQSLINDLSSSLQENRFSDDSSKTQNDIYSLILKLMTNSSSQPANPELKYSKEQKKFDAELSISTRPTQQEVESAKDELQSIMSSLKIINSIDRTSQESEREIKPQEGIDKSNIIKIATEGLGKRQSDFLIP
ncbi:hypothetical protein MXB_290, partial [Myxobolus squamalis]